MVYALAEMARQKSLTHSGIADAALAVIDSDGLPALSMRTVANELGIGTMSLYRYVTSREDLERLVVDLVLFRVDVDLPSRASWTKQVTVLAERIRSAVGEHRGVVPLLMAHRHDSRGVTRAAEGFLRALAAGGFTGKRRVIALRTIASYLNGALQAQHVAPLEGTATRIMTQLPTAEYPLLAETAHYALQVNSDEEFRGGLEILLRGLAAPSSSGRSSTKRSRRR